MSSQGDTHLPDKHNAHVSPFERIKRVNEVGVEYWSSRDFARVLGYTDYRNFEQVVRRARMACFNSGQRVEDHFVDITEMIEIGKGGNRRLPRRWTYPRRSSGSKPLGSAPALRRLRPFHA